MWQKIKNIYHLFNSILANTWFGFPSRKLTVIGVTGTDGKTTTTSLIYHILKTSGAKVSVISSVGAIINGKDYPLPFHVTTPSAYSLAKFIKMAISKSNLRNGKKYLVLEVTSHSLDQFRVFGINFDIGVITNVSHEHLDYHKTYEEYINTKLKLLKMSKIAVINKDDRSYGTINTKLKRNAGKISRVVTYGLTKAAEINSDNFKFESNILGEFNKYNILAAIAVCKNLEIKREDIQRGVKTFSPPLGRQDIVYDKDFTVMIDFAHTPNSFEEILSTLKQKVKGRIIHVFGAAGERDALKRPEMGRISSQYSNFVIVTAEDPRSESIDGITQNILSGIKDKDLRIKKGTVLTISNRQEAINTAIKIAGENDLVLITGKAHEKSMNSGKGEEPWDEYKAVEKALVLKHEKN